MLQLDVSASQKMNAGEKDCILLPLLAPALTHPRNTLRSCSKEEKECGP